MGIRAGGQVQVVGVGAQLLTVGAAGTGGLAAELAIDSDLSIKRGLTLSRNGWLNTPPALMTRNPESRRAPTLNPRGTPLPIPRCAATCGASAR